MKIRFILLLLFFCVGAIAHGQKQEALIEVDGYVFNSWNKEPLEGIMVSAKNMKEVGITDEKGYFSLSIPSTSSLLTLKSADFHTKIISRGKETALKIYLLPLIADRYGEVLDFSFKKIRIEDHIGSSVTLHNKDFDRGRLFADDMLVGNVAGVRTLQKSGMPGEGNFFSIRGTRSLVGSNTPLIVVDGMPIISDTRLSSVFTAYSKNILRNVSLKEVGTISVVKGFDANSFGSMASNGVIMINTDRATDMETKVEFETVNAVSLLAKEIPVLNGDEFKNYLLKVGQTLHTQDQIMNVFPFLHNDPSMGLAYYPYTHNTDWQKEVFAPNFSTENTLKVKGGDATAKYSLLAGYARNAGIETNTSSDRYFVRVNGDMQMNRKLVMFANIGFNYFDNKLHEQGMVKEINPMLTALLKPSILGPKQMNKYGEVLDTWDPVRDFGISNPTVVSQEVTGANSLYNIAINIGLDYEFTPELKLKGLVGIDHDYSREQLFIPGVTTESIAHLEGGRAKNMIRNGVGKSMAYYGNVSLNYSHDFKDGHYISTVLGSQLLMKEHLYEYAQGLNTATDYDQQLSDVKDVTGKHIAGYDEPWRWCDFFAEATYNYNKQWYFGAGVSVDASSIVGEAADLFYAYPSVNVAWNMANASFLKSQDWLDHLLVRAEYSQKGNTMFTSMASKYYYTTNSFQQMGGIIRANIPNDKLEPELVSSMNIGLDFRTLGNRINLKLDYYQDNTTDMILPENLDDVFGSKFRYVNSGEMRTNGLELGIHAKVLQIGDFEWNLGGTIASEKTEVISLGEGVDQRLMTLTDGTEMITRVGDSPYQFYGLKTLGVYSTSDEANGAGLKNHEGKPFRAGDMKYLDAVKDQVIDKNDKVVIGDPNPDFYGGLFTSFRYKAFSLSAQFTYSYGNEVYNAVRRMGESMIDLTNQTTSVENAWYYEGHMTNMPRAEYGDPMKNSAFSSRWIEDGSYLKLKNLTLNYEHPRKLWVFTKFQAYVTAENVFTYTNYLGYDPEFAYSYDHAYLGIDYGKVPGARTFKLGVKLGF